MQCETRSRQQPGIAEPVCSAWKRQVHTYALLMLQTLIVTLKKVVVVWFSDGCSPKVSEQELYHSVQGILPREGDTQQALDCIKKGTRKHASDSLKAARK